MKTDNSFTKSEIFTQYNVLRGIAKRNPRKIDVERLNRALGILQGVDPTPNHYCAPNGCACKDWQYRYSHRRKDFNGDYYTGACKHMLFAWMVENILAERDPDSLEWYLRESGRNYKTLFDRFGVAQKIYEGEM